MSTMPEDYSNSSEMVSLSTYDIKLFSSLPAGSLDLISAAETECPLTTTSLSCWFYIHIKFIFVNELFKDQFDGDWNTERGANRFQMHYTFY